MLLSEMENEGEKKKDAKMAGLRWQRVPRRQPKDVVDANGKREMNLAGNGTTAYLMRDMVRFISFSNHVFVVTVLTQNSGV